MNGKTVLKILLDIAMTALFAALLFAYGTGLVFHEIAGLSILFLFALHLALNGRWVAGVLKGTANGTLKRKPAFKALLAIGLLAGVVAVSVTGLMISTVVLPTATFHPGLVALHKWSAYFTAGLMAIHLGLHAKTLAATFKRLFARTRRAAIRSMVVSGFALAMTIGVVYYNVVSAAGGTAVPIVTSEPAQAEQPTAPATEDTAADESTAIQEKKKEEESDTSITTSEPPAETAAVTLSDYLGKLHCTACGKHCPLSSPRCGRSAAQVEQATTDYEALYGDT